MMPNSFHSKSKHYRRKEREVNRQTDNDSPRRQGNTAGKFKTRVSVETFREERKKIMNILLLGQTGVGKSTFINGILNYLNYESLLEAEQQGVLTAVPTSFTITNDNFEVLEIHISPENSHDVKHNKDTGSSATLNCVTHQIPLKDYELHIIDTPGIGDTRGIKQDKENFKMILDHIRYLDVLHGICILLKPNETRLNTLFRFCIKELLTHLHSSASNNIVFCFTNARHTMFRPGETWAILKKLLKEFSIRLDGKDKLFCLDNDAYRYLCTLQEPSIKEKNAERKIYQESWDRSVDETKRMIQTIQQMKPHEIQDTITLNNTRRVILSLSKPLADITQIVEYNIEAMKGYKEEIERAQTIEKDLIDKLHFPGIKLITKRISHPRTVCTNSSCVVYENLKNTRLLSKVYTQICHDNCTTQGVIEEKFPDDKLQTCSVMKDGMCLKCGCSWKEHMHIFYEQEMEETETIDEEVREEMKQLKSSRDRQEKLLIITEEKIEDLERTKSFILDTCAKLGSFLYQNSITPYNDTINDYLEYLIENEKNKPEKTENEKRILDGLRKSQKTYQEQCETIKRSIDKGIDKKITPEEVRDIIDRVCQIPDHGLVVHTMLQMSLFAQRNAALSMQNAIVPSESQSHVSLNKK